jgi:predicted nucleic acid-binding protein
VYLDLCCLNRPFDDQTQLRIRLESEAVIALIRQAVTGELRWLSSQVIELEAAKNPNPERRRRILLLASHAYETIPLLSTDFERARVLQNLGCQPYDALHIACAERAGAEILLTTDDRLVKFGGRNPASLRLRIENPLELMRKLLP